MWLYAQPWLPLITITLAAGPSEQFYKDSRREQAETLRLRGRPREYSTIHEELAPASPACSPRPRRPAAATYRAVGPLSDETPKAMRPPCVAMHRGFCFSGLKRP